MSKISVREMVLAALFAAIASVGAIFLRFGGEAVVPFSIMPLVVLLAGALLGAKLGALSMFIYVLIGLLGIPVFAKPPYGGPTYILQPTFGFLVGFIVGAYVVGKILEAKGEPSLVWYFLAMGGGLFGIYLLGLPYLYGILNFYVGKAISVVEVLKIGFLPFILFDLIKAILVIGIAKSVAERVKSIKPLS